MLRNHKTAHILASLLLCYLENCWSFNVDTANAMILDPGKKGYYFGYSVALYKHSNKQWLIVGAPLSNDTGMGVKPKYGAVYKCDLSKSNRQCNVMRNFDWPSTGTSQRSDYYQTGQWMGATVRSRKNYIMACAPRFAWSGTNKTEANYFPVGKCEIVNAEDTSRKWRLEPCRLVPREGFGFCNYGIDADFNSQATEMAGGAPRLLGSNGRLIHYQFSRKSSFLSPRFTSKSVSKFADYTVLVAGAPVADLRRGTVEIYKQTTKFSILDELKNPTKQIGSYFGSSLAVADVNGDGYQDLLVGAPYYYTSIEEGIVIVYINNKRGNLDLSPVKLSGDAGPRGRFGMSMVGARDLNNDGYEGIVTCSTSLFYQFVFKDVAIGAPNGGVDGRGVVYIYEGSRNGLSNQYSQKIVPSEFGLVGLSLTAFGSSLSGGLDMDDNGYSDLAVGSFLSDKAVFLRSKPVVMLKGTITLSHLQLNSNSTEQNCTGIDGSRRLCLNTTLCAAIGGDNVSLPVEVTYEYIIDEKLLDNKKRGVFVENSVPKYRLSKRLHIYHRVCVDHLVYMEATYSKNCGTDMICGADLKVMAKIRLPHNKTEIHAGVTENFSFEILVKNYGENAFLTKITTLIPRQLSIIGVHNLKEKFAFLDWNFEYFNETHNQLALDAGNPIGNLEEEHFEVRLTAKSLHTVVDYLSFHVNVTTNSEENNIADNTVVVNANVVLVADMTISGVAIPERVIYSNSRSAKDIGTFILHSFLIQNKGPSTVDNSRVDIYFPEKVENDYILNLISITAEGPVNCYVNDSSYNPLGLQLNLPTGNDRKQTVNRRKRRSIKDKVDCLTGQCQVFKCDLGRMARGESVTIKINSSLVESTFAKKLKRDTYVVVRAVVVSESIRQPRLNFPDSSEPLLTVLSPGRSVDVKGTIPWWIILISIIAGLVLVAGVVFVLYKSGFFNRKKKDYSFSSVADFPDD
eukprot:gene14822-5936_t